jgi:hypothetical protein
MESETNHPESLDYILKRTEEELNGIASQFQIDTESQEAWDAHTSEPVQQWFESIPFPPLDCALLEGSSSARTTLRQWEALMKFKLRMVTSTEFEELGKARRRALCRVFIRLRISQLHQGAPRIPHILIRLRNSGKLRFVGLDSKNARSAGNAELAQGGRAPRDLDAASVMELGVPGPVPAAHRIVLASTQAVGGGYQEGAARLPCPCQHCLHCALHCHRHGQRSCHASAAAAANAMVTEQNLLGTCVASVPKTERDECAQRSRHTTFTGCFCNMLWHKSRRVDPALW